PRLVELDAPAPLLVLDGLELRAEAPPRAAAEAGDGLLRAALLHQLLRNRDRQRLARLLLPDHEAAAGVVLRPARVTLAVLDHVAAADGARAEVRALDLDPLELVELLHRLRRELDDVAHERVAAVGAVLDQAQAVLPAAGQLGRGQRVVPEQPD